MSCIYYKGNQNCDLHKSKVASAYCGDICKDRKEMPTMEELGVDLCEYCPLLKGETYGPHDTCESYGCEEAYTNYLESMGE